MTGAQIRAARALLGWSAQRLTDISKVSLATIQRAEKEDSRVRMTAANVDAIQRALGAAGVIFLEENGDGPGVRLRKSQVGVKP